MRTDKLRAAYQRLVDAGFTGPEVYAAGPLFNPEHPRCLEAKQAVRLVRLASEVDRKHNELLSQLVLAQLDVRDASANLRLARLAATRDYSNAVSIRQCELAVLNAHDKLWAAQRMLQLFDFTYGPTGGIT